MQNYKNKKNQSGVTMMETIVALGVLILGIITALALMASTLSFSQISEQSIIVANLGREGIEMVRSIRSLSGFDILSEGDKTVTINNDGDLELTHLGDIGSISIESCINCSLYLFNGRYVHNDDGDPTIFKRLITISDESASEKKVISQVYWTERGREHTFKLEDHLTDW